MNSIAQKLLIAKTEVNELLSLISEKSIYSLRQQAESLKDDIEYLNLDDYDADRAALVELAVTSLKQIGIQALEFRDVILARNCEEMIPPDLKLMHISESYGFISGHKAFGRISAIANEGVFPFYYCPPSLQLTVEVMRSSGNPSQYMTVISALDGSPPLRLATSNACFARNVFYSLAYIAT